MLKVCQSSFYSTRPRYTTTVTYRTSTIWAYFISFSGFATELVDFRSEAEYLVQGTVFDQFDDKSVWNGQFKGSLTPRLKLYGLDPNIPRDVIVDRGGDWVQMPRDTHAYLCTDRVDNVIWYYYRTKGRYEIWCSVPLQVSYENRTSQVVTCITLVKSSIGLTVDVTYYLSGVDAYVDEQGLTQSLRAFLISLIPRDSKMDIVDGLQLVRSKIDIVLAFMRKAALEVAQYLDSHSGSKGAYVPTNFSWELAPLDSRELRTMLARYAYVARSAHTWTSSDLSTLGRQVVENINDFSSNLLAYVSDIKDIGDSIRSILALVADPDNPVKWASAWLSIRFSDRLTISDTHELLLALREALLNRQYWTRGRSQITFKNSLDSFSVTHTRTSTAIVKNNNDVSLMHSIDALMRWDIWPTLENAWDMIPLSFVVDWFLPVSDILAQVDAYVQVPYLDVISEYIGDRLEVEFKHNTLWAGRVSFVRYTREVHSTLAEVKPFEANLSSIPSFGVANIGDSLALAAQFRMG